MRRLIGFLLVLRAAAPVLAVLVVVWGVSQVTADFQAAIEPPVEQIEAELESLEATFRVAQRQFDTVRTHIAAAVAAVQAFQLPDILPDLPDSLAFPAINIPNPSIQVPSSVSVTWSNFSYQVQEWIPQDCGIFDWLCDAGEFVLETVTEIASYPSSIEVGTTTFTLQTPNIPSLSLPMPPIFNDLRDGLSELFDGLGGIFDIFDGTLSSFRALGETLEVVPDSINTLREAGDSVVTRLGTLAARWSTLLLIVLVVVSLLLAINIIVPMIDDLTRGLRMLFGADPAGIK